METSVDSDNYFEWSVGKRHIDKIKTDESGSGIVSEAFNLFNELWYLSLHPMDNNDNEYSSITCDLMGFEHGVFSMNIDFQIEFKEANLTKIYKNKTFEYNNIDFVSFNKFMKRNDLIQYNSFTFIIKFTSVTFYDNKSNKIFIFNKNNNNASFNIHHQQHGEQDFDIDSNENNDNHNHHEIQPSQSLLAEPGQQSQESLIVYQNEGNQSHPTSIPISEPIIIISSAPSPYSSAPYRSPTPPPFVPDNNNNDGDEQQEQEQKQENETDIPSQQVLLNRSHPLTDREALNRILLLRSPALKRKLEQYTVTKIDEDLLEKIKCKTHEIVLKSDLKTLTHGMIKNELTLSFPNIPPKLLKNHWAEIKPIVSVSSAKAWKRLYGGNENQTFAKKRKREQKISDDLDDNQPKSKKRRLNDNEDNNDNNNGIWSISSKIYDGFMQMIGKQ